MMQRVRVYLACEEYTQVLAIPGTPVDDSYPQHFLLFQEPVCTVALHEYASSILHKQRPENEVNLQPTDDQDQILLP